MSRPIWETEKTGSLLQNTNGYFSKEKQTVSNVYGVPSLEEFRNRISNTLKKYLIPGNDLCKI